MKRVPLASLWTIALASLIAVSAGCASSAVADGAPPRDFSVTYGWSTGSVPPPYNYTRRIQINASGAGTVDVNMFSGPKTTRTFQASGAAMSALYSEMNEQGVFSRSWNADPRPPVGGSSAWTDVRADGETVEIPRHVEGSQAEAAEAVAEAVEMTVPSEIRDELEQWVRDAQAEGSEQ